MSEHEHFMRMAIELGRNGVMNNIGGPFGAVVVKDGNVIGRGWNKVTSTNDPTAHAEVTAIRDACAYLGSFQLDECVIYTSCEPCPMCLGAIYWARPKHIYYAASRRDAADIDFDDDHIYEEMRAPLHERKIPITQVCREEALDLFHHWVAKEDKTGY
ncbi:MAG: nucleoside deaminase [Saprospiraceae bacterium]|nr:nucleoside deaminase [Saprospiraceae bacterium]